MADKLVDHLHLGYIAIHHTELLNKISKVAVDIHYWRPNTKILRKRFIVTLLKISSVMNSMWLCENIVPPYGVERSTMWEYYCSTLGCRKVLPYNAIVTIVMAKILVNKSFHYYQTSQARSQESASLALESTTVLFFCHAPAV